LDRRGDLFIKYAALVIIVLIVAYVVLRIVGVLQGALLF
jgi:hypothetical protein